VSSVGSPVVFPGIARDRKTGGFSETDQPPFTRHGNAMPFTSRQNLFKFLKRGDLAMIRSGLSPIWKINGPILFIAGGDDRLGLSAPMARLGLSVLKQHGHPFRDDAKIYPNAGHLIWPGYRPTFNLEQSPPGIPPVGGNAKGYAGADASFGPDVLRFLRHALESGHLQSQAVALPRSR
jgi:hypothetical protein